MKCCIKANGFCSIHELIEVLIAAIEEKDPYTRGHSDRVADFTSLICEKMQMSLEERNVIHMAAHLHDLGKIYVPDFILNKAGKLSTDEWIEIKKHPETGARILEKVSGFDLIAKIVKHHHERWDGIPSWPLRQPYSPWCKNHHPIRCRGCYAQYTFLSKCLIH